MNLIKIANAKDLVKNGKASTSNGSAQKAAKLKDGDTVIGKLKGIMHLEGTDRAGNKYSNLYGVLETGERFRISDIALDNLKDDSTVKLEKLSTQAPDNPERTIHYFAYLDIEPVSANSRASAAKAVK